MPIYDQSYRPYRGSFSSHATRWWTIARTGVFHVLRRRPFLVLITGTFIPPIVFGCMIYVAHAYPQSNLTRVDAELFRKLMWAQTLCGLILGVYPGSGLISNDLRGNAIQLYLSKPLTRLDYVLGKFAILGLLFGGITLIPGLLLFALELGLSTDTHFIIAYWWLPFSIAAYALCASIAWGLFVLALSSLSRNSRYVAVMIIGLALMTNGFAQFARGIFNRDGVVVISGMDSLHILTYLFFGGTGEYGDQRLGAVIALALMSAASILILRARVKAVEVVT